MKKEKPPLGIIPTRLWKENRAWDLIECLARHRRESSIRSEWWEELRNLLHELGPLTPFEGASDEKVPYPSQGKCAHCGKEVRHGYPWWTGNPARGGKPLHEECAREYGLFGD